MVWDSQGEYYKLNFIANIFKNVSNETVNIYDLCEETGTPYKPQETFINAVWHLVIRNTTQ